MNTFTIYTIPNCPYCVKAKSLFSDKRIEYKEVHFKLLPEETQRKFLEESRIRTFPQIYKDDAFIGGFTDLEKYLQA